MMSLVATPVAAARVAAPKKAAPKRVTVKASASSSTSAAVAGAVSLTLVAQPALAAVEQAFPVAAPQEIAVLADVGDDAAKKAKAQALAASLQSDLVAAESARGKQISANKAPPKVKSLSSAAAVSAPSISFSLPKFEKKAPAEKGAKAAPAPKSSEVSCTLEDRRARDAAHVRERDGRAPSLSVSGHLTEEEEPSDTTHSFRDLVDIAFWPPNDRCPCHDAGCGSVCDAGVFPTCERRRSDLIDWRRQLPPPYSNPLTTSLFLLAEMSTT